MHTVSIDDDDLDDEDRAILREVSKKGYYHGRPPSVPTAPPARIDSSEAAASIASSGDVRRAEFDTFQKKWEKFDNDDYLNGLERGGGTAIKKARVDQGDGRSSATNTSRTFSGSSARDKSKLADADGGLPSPASSTAASTCSWPLALVRRLCGRRAPSAALHAGTGSRKASGIAAA
eukprot:TRINITY_DN31700_c0_g1_i2.p1 TRINITY_DN31700_c0_g1~~TRINITY_DN31700_c0_g1_i2.p1  ORF type:complete len:177 (-),score=42.55 TRINITY_DN31700_c0_g1_i2:148-678(-)